MDGDVGVDINQAETSILKSCLRFWCDDQVWEKWEDTTLVDYATNHWYVHLAKIQLSMVPAEEKRIVSALLAKTLCDERVLERAINALRHFEERWLHTTSYSTAIMGWLKDPEAISSLEGDSAKWAASLTSDKDVVKNIVTVYAKNWLQHPEWNAPRCCEIVLAYLRKVPHPCHATMTGNG